MFSSLASFFVGSFRWIYIALQTLPRDIVGVTKLIQTIVGIKIVQISGKSVSDVFDGICEKYSSKICFRIDSEHWTFGEIQEKSNQIGNFFQSRGYKKGDSVVIFMESCPEFVYTWLGLSRIGVISYLVNTNLRLEPLKRAIEISKCKAIIYGEELTQAIADLIVNKMLTNVQPELFRSTQTKTKQTLSTESGEMNLLKKHSKNLGQELVNVSKIKPKVGKNDKPIFTDNLFSIYTSGTTGFPKAAIVKHSRFLSMSIGYHYLGDLKSTDVLYTCLPMYHSVAGITATGQALILGKTVVIRPKFSASEFWKDCIKHKVTVIQTIGELCRYLLNRPVTPEETEHKVRLILDSGLKPAIWKTFLERFKLPKVIEFYGSTEGNCGLINEDGKVGAVGFIPIWLQSRAPVGIFKVNKETGELLRNPQNGLAIRCKVNEPGEMIGKITIGNPIREFGGYANDKKGTEKQILKDVFYKGSTAFRTGDYLVMDELGYVYFHDRAGDSFRWKGENVSTAEVESVISAVCDLKDCAVYGVEIIGTNGKAGMAAIVNQYDSLDLNNLSNCLKNTLPSYARPMFLRVTSHLKKTATHKLQKAELKRQGFNILEVADPIYFYLNEKYVSLDEDLYNKIISGKIKL